MRIRKRKLPLLLVIVGILVLLLPLLAYLQYDWLGKVSEREREQMQTALQRSLSQFTQEFDREISRILVQFHGPPEQVERTAADYAKIYAAWNSSAPYPRLIRDIFMRQPTSSGGSLQRLNVAERVWEPASSIPEFASPGEFEQAVDAAIPAVVIPMFRFKSTSNDHVLLSPPDVSRLIIRLNLEYIQKAFIPALVQSHLAGMTNDYYLQISREGDASRIIYSSNPGTPIEREGDASEHFFGPSLNEAPGIVAVSQPLTAAAPVIETGADHVFSIHVTPEAIGLAHGMAIGRLSEFRPNGWRLTAVHRMGSLDL